MDISWLGHACFRLSTSNTILITDPFPSSLGIPFGHPLAHIVTVSNPHPNHNNLADLAEDPKVIRGPGEYEIKQFYIQGFTTRPGRETAPQNTAYTIRAEGITLCHLGDITHPLPSQLVKEFRSPDILFVPVGGGCTLSAPEAISVVEVLEPRIVIPMHFGMPRLQLTLESVDPFLKAAGAGDHSPQTSLKISRSSLPPDRTVILLKAPS